MRTTALAAAAALVATLATGCGNGDSSGNGGQSASCVGPLLGAKPFETLPPTKVTVVAREQVLTLHGRWFTPDCFDSGPSAGAVGTPAAEVRISLRSSDGRSHDLGTVHPSGRMSAFVARVTIPRRVSSGQGVILAAVHDDRGDPVGRLRVVIRPLER